MKKLVFLLILVVLFTGCIKYNEEMWLNKDGSGKMVMKLGMPNMGFEGGEMDPSSDFNEVSGVKLVSQKSYKENDMTIYEMEVEFDFVDSLSKLDDKEDADASGFVGDIEMYLDENDHVVFNRYIDFESAEEDTAESSDEMGDAMFNAMFAQYKWEYTVHFSYKILSTNADEANWDKKNNTVKWVFPLSELSKPKLMTVTMESAATQSPKLMLIIAIAVGVVLIIAIATFMVNNFNKKRLKNESI